VLAVIVVDIVVLRSSIDAILALKLDQ